MRKYLNFRANIALGLVFAFFFNSLGPIPTAKAEPINSVESEFYLPAPGILVNVSPAYTPSLLKGIVIHPDNALKFDFIIYKGDSSLPDTEKRIEYNKLIKYFLASLAVPDKDQWVNLSPYEKNRIIENDFGKTEMGRDLLAQDYLLKQITSSLIYPEKGLGKEFWAKVYTQAYERYGNTNIPVNTFNKVWITPDSAVIYEKGNTAYVLKNHLKVMLEEDYLSLHKHLALSNDTHSIGANIIREIILPALEKEVNEGKNFAPLRQVYSGMLLAAWYKRALKESLLGKVYADKARVKGVEQDPKNNEVIYERYLQAFKKGVFNYIKEDIDPYTQQPIPRKYFSGGTEGYAKFDNGMVSRIRALDPQQDMAMEGTISRADLASVAFKPVENNSSDAAMALRPAQSRPDINWWLANLTEVQRSSFQELVNNLDRPNSVRDALTPLRVLLTNYRRELDKARNTVPFQRSIILFLEQHNLLPTLGLSDDLVYVLANVGYVQRMKGPHYVIALKYSFDKGRYVISLIEERKGIQLDLDYNARREAAVIYREIMKIYKSVTDIYEMYSIAFQLRNRFAGEGHAQEDAGLEQMKETILATYLKYLARKLSVADEEFNRRMKDGRLITYVDDIDHGPRHAADLLDLAYHLAAARGIYGQVDWKVLIAAIALHDIFAYEDYNHAPKAEEYARRFLKDELTGDQINKVVWAIRLHDKRTSRGKFQRAQAGIESQILFDIDQLEAFGYKGIYRFIAVYARRKMSLDAIKTSVPKNALIRFHSLYFEQSKEIAEKSENYSVLSSFFDELNNDNKGAEWVASFIIEHESDNPILIANNALSALDHLKQSGLSGLKEQETLYAINIFRNLEHVYRQQNVFTEKLGDLIKSPDAAMPAAPMTVPGGIDLNSANLAMTIKRDGKGVALPFAQQDMARWLANIEGFVPDITEIKPASMAEIGL